MRGETWQATARSYKNVPPWGLGPKACQHCAHIHTDTHTPHTPPRVVSRLRPQVALLTCWRADFLLGSGASLFLWGRGQTRQLVSGPGSVDSSLFPQKESSPHLPCVICFCSEYDCSEVTCERQPATRSPSVSSFFLLPFDSSTWRGLNLALLPDEQHVSHF